MKNYECCSMSLFIAFKVNNMIGGDAVHNCKKCHDFYNSSKVSRDTKISLIELSGTATEENEHDEEGAGKCISLLMHQIKIHNKRLLNNNDND